MIAGEQREYGKAQVFIEQHKGAAVHVDRLFSGLGSELEVWVSQGESNSEQYDISVLVNKSRRQALKSSSQIFNYCNDEKLVAEEKPIFGIQFHPEVPSSFFRFYLPAWLMSRSPSLAYNSVKVTHTPMGSAILRNFAVSICEARQHWTMDEFVGKEIARIRQLVGEKGQVIGGYPRHMQGLHYANFVQALYPGESTLRFVLSMS